MEDTSDGSDDHDVILLYIEPFLITYLVSPTAEALNKKIDPGPFFPMPVPPCHFASLCT